MNSNDPTTDHSNRASPEASASARPSGSYIRMDPRITPKPHARLEKWTWILIYGGLLATILGIATGRSDAALGWAIAVPGAVAAAVGVVLIYVRSRQKNTESPKPNSHQSP